VRESAKHWLISPIDQEHLKALSRARKLPVEFRILKSSKRLQTNIGELSLRVKALSVRSSEPDGSAFLEIRTTDGWNGVHIGNEGNLAYVINPPERDI